MGKRLYHKMAAEFMQGLVETTGLDEEDVIEMTEELIKDGNNVVAEARKFKAEVLDGGDYVMPQPKPDAFGDSREAKLGRMAHGLKGTASIMGLEDLAQEA